MFPFYLFAVPAPSNFYIFDQLLVRDPQTPAAVEFFVPGLYATFLLAIFGPEVRWASKPELPSRYSVQI